MVKIKKLQDIVKSVGDDPTLQEEFLRAALKDIFNFGLSYDILFSKTTLSAEVKIGTGQGNIEDLIARYSLREENVLELAQSFQHNVLGNSDELRFSSTYAHTIRRVKINIIDYHEPDNIPFSLDKKREHAINTWVYIAGASVPAWITASLAYNQYIASSPTINIAQQFVVWGLFGGLAYLMYKKNSDLAKRNRIKTYERYREVLGKELIIDEEDVDVNEDAEIRPSTDHYRGLKATYAISSKTSLSLREWLQRNPDKPIFKVALSGASTKNIIWPVGLEMKVGNEHFCLYLTTGLTYVLEREPIPHENLRIFGKKELAKFL